MSEKEQVSEKYNKSEGKEENKENDYKFLDDDDENPGKLSNIAKENKSIILQSNINDIEEVQLSEGLRNKGRAGPAVESSSSSIHKSPKSSSHSSPSSSSSSSSSPVASSSPHSSHNSNSLKF